MSTPLTDPEQDAWCRIVALKLMHDYLHVSHEIHPFPKTIAALRVDIRGVARTAAFLNAWLDHDKPLGDVISECAADHMEGLIATLEAAGRYMERKQKEHIDARTP